MRSVKAALAVLSMALVATASSASAGRQAAAALRVTVTGSGHVATAGTPWSYTVRAHDSAGRRVGGTAIVRVLAHGKVVDTVGWFSFNGVLRRTYRWPAALSGSYAVLRAKVVAPSGTRAAGYGVRVRSGFARVTGHPRFQLRLLAAGHAASAGTPWRYTVRVFDSKGRPVGGTAIVRVVAHGAYVDTVGWFKLKGVLRRTYRWSPSLGGSPAIFQVRVIGPGGTRAVRYAVRVS
jgi:hypothetical protein